MRPSLRFGHSVSQRRCCSVSPLPAKALITLQNPLTSQNLHQTYPKSSHNTQLSARIFARRRYSSISGENPPSSEVPDCLVESPVVLRRSRKRSLADGLEKSEGRSKDWDSDTWLVRNPWALALASPPRVCSATFARLPTELMIDFGLVKHPSTSALWIMPTTLLEDELKAYEAGTATGATPETTDEGNAPTRRKTFPKLRITNNGGLFDTLSGSQRSSIGKSLVPNAWKQPEGPLPRSMLKNIVWRADMFDFLLRTMRRKAVMGITNIVNAPPRAVKRWKEDSWTSLSVTKGPVTQSSIEESLGQLPELPGIKSGIVLILHSNEPVTKANTTSKRQKKSPNPLEDPSSNSLDEPPSNTRGKTALPMRTTITPRQTFDLVELPKQESQVPVFDLTQLLSLEDIKELRQLGDIFRESEVVYFIPATKKSARVVLDLWRLKNLFMDREQVSLSASH